MHFRITSPHFHNILHTLSFFYLLHFHKNSPIFIKLPHFYKLPHIFVKIAHARHLSSSRRPFLEKVLAPRWYSASPAWCSMGGSRVGVSIATTPHAHHPSLPDLLTAHGECQVPAQTPQRPKHAVQTLQPGENALSNHLETTLFLCLSLSLSLDVCRP